MGGSSCSARGFYENDQAGNCRIDWELKLARANLAVPDGTRMLYLAYAILPSATLVSLMRLVDAAGLSLSPPIAHRSASRPPAGPRRRPASRAWNRRRAGPATSIGRRRFLPGTANLRWPRCLCLSSYNSFHDSPLQGCWLSDGIPCRKAGGVTGACRLLSRKGRPVDGGADSGCAPEAAPLPLSFAGAGAVRR